MVFGKRYVCELSMDSCKSDVCHLGMILKALNVRERQDICLSSFNCFVHILSLLKEGV